MTATRETVDEVYDLSRPLKMQLDQERAFFPESTRLIGMLP